MSGKLNRVTDRLQTQLMLVERDPSFAGTTQDDPAARERRRDGDRRHSLLWSLLYGGFRPRRRSGRRVEDQHRPIVDWHDPALLFSAFGLLMLCVCDGALTLALLAHGANEANPVMDLVVNGDMTRFALVKLALTASGLLILVSLARFTVFRMFRASVLVHAALAGYAILVCYELWLVGFMIP